MSYIDAQGPHSLLEPTTPAYTNATVRRAFIVWMHCGQKNTFKDVCNYYHYLECLEEKLPADHRASSRHHEFNMFTNPPPTSPYLDTHFPKLYTQSHTIQHYMKKVDNIRNHCFTDERQLKTTPILKQEDAMFKCVKTTKKSEDYNLKNDTQNINLTDMKGMTNEIVETSEMIKKYCKTYMKPLKKFLQEFNDYTKKCDLKCTVNNVAFYIKRKMVEEELQMVYNYSKTLSFLNLSEKKLTRQKTNGKTNDFLNDYLSNLTNNHHDVFIKSNVTRT